jgi:uncharacterized membrane protein required for colicin V production
MGLDVALGVVILMAAIRGWLQGFLYQILRIGGLIACVYVAVPVRDQVKPHILPYLPTIQPDLIDRLLWWVSAGLSYVVIVGVSTLLLKITRRPEIPGLPPQRNRNDQFAGFLLGIAKGALIGVFLVAGLRTYALKRIESIPWAETQAKTSLVIQWDDQYHPATRIWSSLPVRHFVNHIQRMGLQDPADQPAPGEQNQAGDRPLVKTARRTERESAAKSPRAGDSQTPPPAPPAPEATKTRGIDRGSDRPAEETKALLDSAADPRSS